jgi:predicted nucleic acid-binding protein
MIAVDTSTFVAYLEGATGLDVERFASALTGNDLVLPSIVVTELLSDPGPRKLLEPQIERLTMLPILDGYWERAGGTRRKLRTLGLRAKIADALIAQLCIDHDVALITRDNDFRHFEKHCGLKLA